MKKSILMTTLALGACAFLLMAQDGSKFNGTWKGEVFNQTRKLEWKNGVVYMEEVQENGKQILRQYPTQGQEVTMTEGVWAGSKAVGKMEGNKLSVDTVMPNGTKWHDEWTVAEDGKSYSALRIQTAQGEGGAFGKAGGGKADGGGGGAKGPGGAAPGGGAPGGGKAPGGGGAKGKGGGGPETFHRIQ